MPPSVLPVIASPPRRRAPDERFRGLPIVAVAAGAVIVAGFVVSSTVAAPTYWLVALWAAWGTTVAWIALSRHPSLAMAGLQTFLLLEVLAPATIAVREGRTMIGIYDVSEGTVAALQLTVLAQVALLAGAVGARALGRSGPPVRVRDRLPADRLDRWSVRLLAGAAAGLVLYVVTSGGDPRRLLVLVGDSKYRDFLRSTEGPVINYFSVLLGLAGVAIIIAVLRLTLGAPHRRWVPFAVIASAVVLLGSGGARWWLGIPAVAATLIWWKTSSGPLARRPRTLLAAGALGLFVMAVMVGGLRDQAGHKEIDVGAFVDKQFRGGVFATTAVLVERVPSRHDHLHGSSYAEVVALPVPRALWADKPEPAVRDLQRVFFRQEIGASFAFYGELYANFGWVGTAIGCVGFGALLETAWLRLVRARRPATLVFFAAAVPVLLQLFSRGYLAGLVAALAGFVVGLLVVTRALRRLEGGSGQRVGADPPSRALSA
jgi:hypothetical protein